MSGTRKAARNLNLAGSRGRAIQVRAADEFTPECAAGNPGNSGGRDHKLCANRRPNNGPVYARGSCDNPGQDIRSLCTSSNTSVGSQGAATTSFRLRQMESGRTASPTSGSALWLAPVDSLVVYGAPPQVALERTTFLLNPQDPLISTLQRKRLISLHHPQKFGQGPSQPWARRRTR